MNVKHLYIINKPLYLLPVSGGAICMVVVKQTISVLETKITHQLNMQPFLSYATALSLLHRITAHYKPTWLSDSYFLAEVNLLCYKGDAVVPISVYFPCSTDMFLW